MSEFIINYELVPLKWRDGYGLSDIDLTEEIVRCRDCCNGHQTPVRGFRCWHWMELDGNGDPVPAEVAPDGYCSQGKRRDE